MKTLHLLLAILPVIVFLGFELEPAQADDTNNISIKNIQVQPSTVKVGTTFSISATLVNNSTGQIYVETNDCTGAFSVIFDNHVNATTPQACTYMLMEHRLDPSKKFSSTNPPSGIIYKAISPGTVNATVTFSYSVLDREEKISKPLLFTISNSSTSQSLPLYGGGTTVTITLDPLEQVKSGVAASNVTCVGSLTLVIKSEDGTPACVKHDTALKLISRGWATSRLNDPRSVNQKLIDAAKNLEATKVFLDKYPNSQADIEYYGGKGEQLVSFSPPRAIFNDTKHPPTSRTIDLQIPVSVSNFTVYENDARMRCTILSFDENNGVDYQLYPSSNSSQTLEDAIQDNNCFDTSILPSAQMLGNMTKMYVTLEQGNATLLQAPLGFSGAYHTQLLQLYGAMPGGIDTWVFPPQLEGNLSRAITLGISTSPDTKPGEYVIPITGDGWIEDYTTGTKTFSKNIMLAEVHLTVKPYSGLGMHLESIAHNFQSFCVEKNSCASGPTNDYLDLTLSSAKKTNVTLSVAGPKGVWAKAFPSVITAGPDGTVARVVTAGISISDNPRENAGAKDPLVITASADGVNVTRILGVQIDDNSTILQGAGPITLDRQIASGNEGLLSTLAIVVYDPENHSGSLPVSLSVLGMINGSTTSPLPSWLAIVLPHASFLLNATEPYYIPVGITTNGAPQSGTYEIAISEDVGGKRFVMPEKIIIENMWL
ncbi:MAG: hypothetical protein ACREBI_07900 [Nitrosotalea sp.]